MAELRIGRIVVAFVVCLALPALAVTGHDTRWVQESLNKLGYQLPVDGKAGQHTRDAITAFQKQAGFKQDEQDGIAGRVTQAAIEARLAPPPPPPPPKPKDNPPPSVPANKLAGLCAAGPAAEIAKADVSSATMPADILPEYSYVPAGGQWEMLVDGDGFDGDKIKSYQIAVRFDADAWPNYLAAPVRRDAVLVAPVPGSRLTVERVTEKWNGIDTTSLPGQNKRLLRFTMPAQPQGEGTGYWWSRTGEITVLGCGADAKDAVLSKLPVTFSNRTSCAGVAAFVTLLFYVFAAAAAGIKDAAKRQPGYKLFWIEYLDPVVVSSGPGNKGSVSRLQILGFSVLVFGLLFYLMIRLGVLSDLSGTVLELLGISAVGAAASKATDNSRNRIKFQNWAWMINKSWLPPNGLMSITRASWGDLVTGDDGFDIYHFQMIIFSVAVGISLVQGGFGDLATFQIPSSLLSVLGLSQAVYVGGKFVDQPSSADLDAALTELRGLEDAFVRAVQASVPAGGAAPVAPAAYLLAPTEYGAYKQKQAITKTMFRSTLGDLWQNASDEPRVS